MKNDTDQNSSVPSGSPHARRRVPRWVVVVGILVLVVTAAGFGRHFYLGWKERRLVRHARSFLDAGNFNELKLKLDRALALNPNNLEANRISAQAKLKMGDQNAVSWFRHVVELAPDSLDNQIALAEALLHFNQTQEAAKVVGNMGSKANGRADFQDIAGRVAQGMGRAPEAEERFAEAVKISPDNKRYQLRLAIARIKSPDLAVRAKARNDVDRLSSDNSLRAEALRALIVDCVKSSQITRARSLAEQLNAMPDRLFSDRLTYLGVLHALNTPEFFTHLEEIQKDAAKNPELIHQMLSWLNGNNSALLARDWAQKLPAELVAAVPIRLEMARSYAIFGDWKKLRFFLADDKWGGLDYMRHAFLSRCFRELDASPAISKSTWAEAINAAGNKGDALMSLARMALEWHWDSEAEDALWAATKSNRSTEALTRLSQLYYSNRNVPGLHRTFALLIERNPEDMNARNNFVIFSLLLDKDKNRAESLAQAVYNKNPANPMYASTYAFALSCNGKNTQALDIMKTLSPSELHEPSVAAYYGAMLEKAGRNAEAEEYKKIGRNAPLLPEEERMLNLAPAPAPSSAAP